MLNLLKKALKSIFSFVFDVIKLFVWMSLFILVILFNVKFCLKEKGENNGESVQKNFNH